MADRRTYYQGQLVQEDELNAGFTGLENADRNAMVDLALAGVASGLTVAEASPTSLSVQVGGPGVAYDPNGQRCAVPGTQLVDLSVDSLGASTAVTLSGNKKIVSLFIKFARANSDTRPTDETPPQMVNFVNNESFSFSIAQSAEATTPSAPALLADGILLADVTLSFGQTQILNADISTARRQGLMALSGTPHAVNVGSIKATLQALLDIVNGHLKAAADKHPAADILVGNIAATEASQPDLNTAANLMLALQQLRVAANIWSSPSVFWIGGNGAVQSGNINAVLKEIVESLGLTTNVNVDGAARVGAAARGTLVAGSVGTQLKSLETRGHTFISNPANFSTNISADDCDAILLDGPGGGQVLLVNGPQPYYQLLIDFIGDSGSVAVKDEATGTLITTLTTTARKALVYRFNTGDVNAIWRFTPLT